ncbi:hypothetical protein ACP70R_002991 [Stipagrostis hirtigluma subsp. patula]
MPTVSPHSPCLTALPPPPEEQRGDDVAAAEAGAGDGEVPAVDKQLAVTEGGEKLAAAEAMLKYHGVMRVESGDKYEAYISNNGQVNGQKGIQQCSYVAEEHAARAYDLAALKYWGTGPDTKLNFAISDYEKEIESMKTMSEDEFMAYIMRQSSCFSTETSPKCGITSRKEGQAQFGRAARGNRNLYLGTFSTEEEASEAYEL